MAVTAPPISDMTYRDLVDETLARIPVHNPEWTNFNDSDPGVTLVQLFSFLTENLLYRSNRIPDENRAKFLSLLGIPLQPGAAARGIVTLLNEGGFGSHFLQGDVEVRAGEVPFRTDAGLDVLPIESQVFYRRLTTPDPASEAVYRQLYASYGKGEELTDLRLYETVPLVLPSPWTATGGVDLAADTIDSSLWIALLRRVSDGGPSGVSIAEVREELAGKTVNLGLVPALTESTLTLAPGTLEGQGDPLAMLNFEIPNGRLGDNVDRLPRYLRLTARTTNNPLVEPGVVQLTLPNPLPPLWDDVEPLEEGVGNMPPPLEDSALQDRIVTWIRLRLDSAEGAVGQGVARLLWVALNSVMVTQRTHVVGETLPNGTGEPGQVATLAHRPVVANSVRLEVRPRPQLGSEPEVWTETNDLLAAGAEIDQPDPRLAPGRPPSRTAVPATAFALDAAKGVLRFGDGYRGKRPPLNAGMQVSYDYSSGRVGNVGPGAINSGSTLPDGVSVHNEPPTWGGSDAETVADGEKQIARYLQHRDRLVTGEDFETITKRTPGVELGRVDVLPAFHPDLSPNEPGDAPGAVTIVVIPKHDSLNPSAPMPDRLFLKAICEYLDTRRLVTTEVLLRGPIYKGIWISVAIRPVPGASIAEVREAVGRRLMSFLSPLPQRLPDGSESPGWPLRNPVFRLQLLAEASRVPGVLLIENLQLARDAEPITLEEQVEMVGLELPQVIGISTDGLPVDELRRQSTQGFAPPLSAVQSEGQVLAVPVIPSECR